jgi:hypothetical protein
MVMASMKSSGGQADWVIHTHDLETAKREPAELLLDLRRRPALVPDQYVEHFREIHRADPGRIGSVTQQRLDFGRRRFAGQGGDDRLRVEDGQRRLLR